eukprot:scaffold96635_cov69-Phaeocystis_antarctica.AAC.1
MLQKCYGLAMVEFLPRVLHLLGQRVIRHRKRFRCVGRRFTQWRCQCSRTLHVPQHGPVNPNQQLARSSRLVGLNRAAVLCIQHIRSRCNAVHCAKVAAILCVRHAGLERNGTATQVLFIAHRTERNQRMAEQPLVHLCHQRDVAREQWLR